MTFNVVTSLALIGLVAGLGWMTRSMPWDAERVAGAVVAAVSAALVIAARMQLGRAFSVRAKAMKLVTTGLYARIRNPIYVFAMFFIVGLALYLRQLWMMLLIVALLPGQIKRSRNEARVLHEAFGTEYERYRAQTWF